MNRRLDTLGIATYIGLCFAASVAAGLLLRWGGNDLLDGNPMRAQLAILSLMFAPALASIIVRTFVTKEGFDDAGLRFGTCKPYVKVWGTILLLFAAIYGCTALAGYKPDWSLQSFTNLYKLPLPMPAPQMIGLIFFASITIVPFINAVAGFGEELGWRGYLLPKLLPLGTRNALVLSSLVWGLWHTPLVLLIGFGNYADRLAGAALFTLIVTCLGVYVGYLRLKHGSTYLAAFAHGMINSQAYGIWAILFLGADPFVAGFTGIVGLCALFLLAVYVLRMKVTTLR